MRICLFTSGYVRTLFHCAHKNYQVIKNTLGECEIDICYSFWDKNERNDRINDPWHYKIDDFFYDNVVKKDIDEYLFQVGFSKVKGEIESFNISQKLILESPFVTHKRSLSSQYYKIHRVSEKYFDSNNNYDLYVTIRPDVIIKEFVSKTIVEELNKTNGIIVNENYWYNAPYKGMDCNEYIWISTKDSFLNTNNQFLYINKLITEVYDQFGEIITGKHFRNLLDSGVISSIDTFNFDYRIVR